MPIDSPARSQSVDALPSFDREAMRTAVADFLDAAGLAEDAAGEAPDNTVAAWINDLLSGYSTDPGSVLEPTWPERAGDIITSTSIPVVSVCAHHLLPFFGHAHVAYLPDKRLTGLSRIEELVRCLSRRLQMQERLGEEIAEELMSGVGALGAACVLEAEHLCVFARGRRQRGSVTRTAAFVGSLATNERLQDHCLTWLRPTSPAGRDQHEPRAAAPSGSRDG